MDVGEVLVRIQGDVSGLRAAVDTAVTKLDQLGKAAKNSGQAVEDASKKTTTAAVAMGSAIGSFIGNLAVQGATSLIRYAGSIKDLASEMTDLSKQTNIAVSTLLILKPTLENNGTSVQAFANSVFRLGVEIGQVKQTTDPVYQSLKELKINFDAIRAADPAERVRMLATAFQNMEDPIQKDAIAMRFFGLTFRQLSGSMDEIIVKMNQTDDAIDKAAETLNQSKAKWNNFVSWIETSALLAFANLSDRLAKTLEQVKGIKSTLESIKPTFGTPNKISPADVLRQGQLGGPEALLSDIAPGLGASGERISPPKFTVIDPEAVSKAKAAKSAVDSFVDSLQKQINTQKALLETQGKGAAAEKEAIQLLELESFKQQLLRDTGVKMTAKQEAGYRALVGQLRDIIDATEEYKGKLADAAQSSEILNRAMDAFGKVQSTTFSETQDQLNAIDSELSQIISDYNTAAANDALPPWMDVEKLRDAANAIADIKRQLVISKAQGPTPADLLDTGEQQDREKAIESVKSLNKSLSDLGERETMIGSLSSALGVNYDAISDKVSLYTERIKLLVAALRTVPEGSEEAQRFLLQLGKTQQDLVTAVEDQRSQQVWNSLADSINNAINTSINGVIQGTQSLGEALKNMAKSIMLAFVTELNQQFIINPILDLLFGARGAGGQRQSGGGLIGMGVGFIGSLLGGIFGGGGSSLAGESFVRGRAFGGPIPMMSYAAGGGIPIMAHAGEYVMSAPAVRRIGMGNLSKMNSGGSSSGAMSVSLDFQGAQIIPKAPWTTPEDVVKVGVKHLNDDGTWISVIGHRMSRK